MDVITTTLKREWFTQIVDGTKRVEYREIKPYWTKRLRAVQVPFKLVLRNGMHPPVPVLTVIIDRITPDPRGRARKGEYAKHPVANSVGATAGADAPLGARRLCRPRIGCSSRSRELTWTSSPRL